MLINNINADDSIFFSEAVVMALHSGHLVFILCDTHKETSRYSFFTALQYHTGLILPCL